MEPFFIPLSILTFAIAFIVLIYSAILHEIAHGYVAERLGDPTARLMGRLTLNPIPHIDPFLSILLPLILLLSPTKIIFGGAKPVPIDPYNLKDGRRDIALVSFAGPATNIILMLIGYLLFTIFFHKDQGYFFDLIFRSAYTIHSLTDIFAYILVDIIFINLSLAVFNLLPIPPLDGSKIFALILPEDMANAYLSLSSFGTLILLILLMFPIGGFSLMNVVGSILTYSLSLLGLWTP